jgi:dihydroorotate dehydrogenase electron transfer subunit
MTTLADGDVISIIGPLGNGFSVSASKKLALLVAGGMGAPPLQHLARILKSNFAEVKVVAFAGAKTLGDLPFTEQDSDKNGSAIAEFAGFCAQSHVATDDGSAGFRGFVTEHLREWLKANDPPAAETVIYSCGPEQMLAEVAKIAAEYDIDCEVSMERMMACGIGLCQSCAVEVLRQAQDKYVQGGDTVYKLCCKDGPVFDAREVVFGQG